MTAQFENIYLGLGASSGKLRIASSGLGWKSSDESESLTTVPNSDIKWIQWIRVARNYQLRIGTAKTRITFDGFLKEDLERLTNLVKQYYDKTIETKDISVRGWNWGVAEVQSQDLAFLVSGKPAFTLPLSSISNTSITKSEVTLEFTSAQPPPPVDEDALARKKRIRATGDEVSEIRFYVPGTANSLKKKGEKAARVAKVKAEGGDDAKAEEEEDEESDEDSADEGGETAAQVFHDSVKDKADIGLVVGESFCTIQEVLCLTPRGRFDIDMHADFLRLKGKTYDYRIAYSQIQKLYLLPKPDDVHCQFVVNIDPPIRQGQTRYPYLVMQFVKDEMMELDLNLDEETLAQKYEGNLKLHYDDPAFEVISNLFRVLAAKKVTTSGNYQSHEGQSAVKCNVKANEGQLYFLEKQLLFISKQPLLVAHSDIHSVTFARVGGSLPSARTFDLSLVLRSSPGTPPLIFSSLNKEEQETIEQFLRMKKIRVKNEMEELAAKVGVAMGDDSDDEDDDGEDRMDVDVKMKGALGEEDDEGSSEDEDFQASSDDGGSGTDSEASGAESDAGSDAAPVKKKQKTT